MGHQASELGTNLSVGEHVYFSQHRLVSPQESLLDVFPSGKNARERQTDGAQIE